MLGLARRAKRPAPQRPHPPASRAPSPSRERGASRPFELLVEGVAGAADGADRVAAAAAVERAAQAADVHVDGALVDIDVVAPDAVEQLLAREDAAGASSSGIRAGGTRSARDAPRGRRGGRGTSRGRARGRRRLSSGEIASGRARRRSAFTRAISSGTENGFTT